MLPCILHVRNTYGELERAVREITQLLESQGMAPHFIRMVNLGLEEVVTNILKYGYDDPQEHQIEIALLSADSELRLEVTDDGHEFNPLGHPEPDADKPLEDREPGGLGISFVRKLFDEVQYRRETGKNILTLRKRVDKL
jgi:anti-sigma regulatory factor (Ser/Thr protein kinase)